jgi:hypothetical protein
MCALLLFCLCVCLQAEQSAVVIAGLTADLAVAESIIEDYKLETAELRDDVAAVERSSVEVH